MQTLHVHCWHIGCIHLGALLHSCTAGRSTKNHGGCLLAPSRSVAAQTQSIQILAMRKLLCKAHNSCLRVDQAQKGSHYHTSGTHTIIDSGRARSVFVSPSPSLFRSLCPFLSEPWSASYQDCMERYCRSQFVRSTIRMCEFIQSFFGIFLFLFCLHSIQTQSVLIHLPALTPHGRMNENKIYACFDLTFADSLIKISTNHDSKPIDK